MTADLPNLPLSTSANPPDSLQNPAVLNRPIKPTTQTHHKLRILVFALIALIIVAGLGIALYKKHQHDLYLVSISPDTIFQKSLEADLSTSRFQHTQPYGRIDAAALNTIGDVSSPAKPVLSSALSMWSYCRTYSIQSYSNSTTTISKLLVPPVDQNCYGRGNIPFTSSDPLYVATTNTVNLRSYGSYDSIYTAALGMALTDKSYDPSDGIGGYALTLVDPREDLFGKVVLGNFSTTQRAKLLALINTQKVYSYDSKQVTIKPLNGRKVYVYPITIDPSKLSGLHRLAATYMDINQDDLPILESNNTKMNATYKFYIDFANHHLLQIDETTNKAQPAHESYTYDSNVVPASLPSGTMSVGYYTVTIDNACQNSKVDLAMPDASVDTSACNVLFNFLPSFTEPQNLH